jgi:hypothetical protein
MEPADSIARLGFNRWYERRLIEAHAWFVSGFICMILVATCMEELSFRGSAARLLAFACLVAVALVICVYGMFRYQRILWEAERVGERATCSACDTYGRFKLISASTARCRKCSHEWRLLD